MNISKIEIKIGIVHFSGEGEQMWLSQQLDKMLDKVPDLLKINFDNPVTTEDGVSEKEGEVGKNFTASFKTSNLASWLKEKSATTNQVKKFLATAAFLQVAGKHRLATGDIIAALKNSNQSKLTNAADNLNANVKKGLV